MFILIIIILFIIIVKVIWVILSTRGIGSPETEKADILRRRNYLISKIVVEPEQLISQMPKMIPEQFKGEWALYSCSMFNRALYNIARLYPETKDDAIVTMEKLIRIVISPEMRVYDAKPWREDPLESLEGEGSHISYLSHLAWMIGGYKETGGDNRFDYLYNSICEAMSRRITNSPNANLMTYPLENIYVPDMVVAIAALNDYSRMNNGRYKPTVNYWIETMRSRLMDEETGMIPSYLYPGKFLADKMIRGSYTALSCYYLTLFDEQFAREQYSRFKYHFLQRWPLLGIKEYRDKHVIADFDIDAGPIVMNLSPSGTAFGIGAATYFGDMVIRSKLLRVAERVGTTVTVNGKRHYLIASKLPVGEAIVLAMRTSYK